MKKVEMPNADCLINLRRGWMPVDLFSIKLFVELDECKHTGWVVKIAVEIYKRF